MLNHRFREKGDPRPRQVVTLLSRWSLRGPLEAFKPTLEHKINLAMFTLHIVINTANYDTFLLTEY